MDIQRSLIETLGPAWPAEPRPSYPHMLNEDRVVWTRWLQLNPGRATAVWYDVHVGEPMPVPTDLGSNMQAVAMAVSRKRIDVVALINSELWITELKPYGSHTALGQVINYRRLFLKEFPTAGPIVGAVICSAIDPDCRADFAAADVRIEEVGYPD